MACRFEFVLDIARREIKSDRDLIKMEAFSEPKCDFTLVMNIV